MKKIMATLLAVGLSMVWAQTGQEKKPAPAKPAAAQIKLAQPPGLYVVFDTTMGHIVCRLFPDKAPVTVKNFVGLTNGTKRWYDYKEKTWRQRRYYDGLTFHRVVPDFMIQGGDPMGNGTGGPGYTFKDELSPDLKFDKPGRLAMANGGPNTNGSQFFITVAPTSYLDNLHTIFGEVVDGQDVAEAIAEVPRDADDKPNTPVVMKKVTIMQVK
jgi:peptidyl-prolyl cis-trans isomerase A (cyclophilin A)